MINEKKALKKKAIKGAAVTITAQATNILVHLVSILTLSRVLPPEDFGVMAMIISLTAFAGLFKDMGLSTASIQKGNLNHAQINYLFWLNVFLGILLTLIIIAISPIAAWFYGIQDLEKAIMLMSLTFLFSSIGAQHAAIIKRDLRFKYLAVAEITGSIFNLLTSIFLALQGYGFWSIVAGTVLGSFVTSTLYIFNSNFFPSRPKKATGMRNLIGFGTNVTLFEVFNYFHRNFDSILIGRYWGAISLGLYNRAYQIMMLPIVSLRTPINTVAFPILSKLKDEPEDFKKYYKKITTILAILSMPTMAFLTIKSDTIVLLALGEKWVEVSPIFALLGISGFIQPVAGLRGLVMLSLGLSKRYLLWGLYNSIAVCLAFSVGIYWGPLGVATAYAIANYLILYPSMQFIFKDTPIKSSDFFSSITNSLISALFAAGCTWTACEKIFNFEKSLILDILISASIFLTTFFLCFISTKSGRKEIISHLQIIKEVIKKPTQA